MKFRVWAPAAKKVELQLGGEFLPMRPDPGQWWSRNVPGDCAGVDYAFRLDEGDVLPDPRSPHQPHGVDGPSRTIDHTAYPWTDEGWQGRPLSSSVLYELHVGTFSPAGTFDGVIEYLDHLTHLGVNYIELMPVAQFKGNRGWGYDGVDLYAPHEAYGGPDGLKRLVDACHAKGLGIILDVVYNHLGPSGNYLPRFGPYFSQRHSTPWGWALNFDGPHTDEVRRFFCDNALMWLRDYHLDGLRLDAVHAIVDTSAVPFLEQLATEVDALKARLGRHLVLIAESDLNDPRVVRPWQMGGFGLDAQWSDDIHHAVHAALTGERDGYYADFGSMSDLALAMQQPFVYAGRHSSFRQRRHGRPATGSTGNNFVAYLQNHDQLGNRAQGDRMTHLVSHERAKLGAALVFLSPFVPMIFQGEEWASTSPFQYFVDFEDEPQLARAVTEGRRREFEAFGWKPQDVPDPQDVETFNRSRLNWDELRQTRHEDMLNWYRQLIDLRHTLAGITDGRFDLVGARTSEKQQWLCVSRGPITIVANFASHEQEIPECTSGHARIVLASHSSASITGGCVSLPGESIVVLEEAEEPIPAEVESDLPPDRQFGDETERPEQGGGVEHHNVEPKNSALQGWPVEAVSGSYASLPAIDAEWHALNIVIETPKGSRNQFKFDPALGIFKLGGVLPAGAAFSFDFGFVPSTLGDDGDPLDVLVLMDEPAFPGCLVPGRLIGVIEAEQTERDGTTVRNDRLIAVASNARDYQDLHSAKDMNDNLEAEIEHFFASYNEMCGKRFKSLGRRGPARASKLLERAMARFASRERKSRRGAKSRRRKSRPRVLK